jgi:hypothetical protein
MFLNYIKEFSVKNKIKNSLQNVKAIVCGIIKRPYVILETKVLIKELLFWYFTGEHRGHCLPGYV